MLIWLFRGSFILHTDHLEHRFALHHAGRVRLIILAYAACCLFERRSIAYEQDDVGIASKLIIDTIALPIAEALLRMQVFQILFLNAFIIQENIEILTTDLNLPAVVRVIHLESAILDRDAHLPDHKHIASNQVKRLCTIHTQINRRKHIP